MNDLSPGSTKAKPAEGLGAESARNEPQKVRNRLAVICPSRGRPKNLDRLARSMVDTATDADLFVVLDDDDENNYPRIEWAHYVVGPRALFSGAANLGLEAAKGYRVIGCVGDDMVFRSRAWDRILIEYMRESGPAVCYGNDLFQKEKLPTQWFVSAEIVDTLGWIVLPELKHLFADNVWMEIGRATGRLKYFEHVIIEHLHYACGKAPLDEVYLHPDAEKDKAVFEHFKKHRLPAIAEKLYELP